MASLLSELLQALAGAASVSFSSSKICNKYIEALIRTYLSGGPQVLQAHDRGDGTGESDVTLSEVQVVQGIECDEHVQEVPDQLSLGLVDLLLDGLLVSLLVGRGQLGGVDLDQSEGVDHTGDKTNEPESRGPQWEVGESLLVNKTQHLDEDEAIQGQVAGVAQVSDDGGGQQHMVHELVVVGLRGSLQVVQRLQETHTLSEEGGMLLQVLELLDSFSRVTLSLQVVGQESRQVSHQSEALLPLWGGVYEFDEFVQRWVVHKGIGDHSGDLQKKVVGCVFFSLDGIWGILLMIMSANRGHGCTEGPGFAPWGSNAEEKKKRRVIGQSAVFPPD